MISLNNIGSLRCFELTQKFSTASTGATDYIIIPQDVDRVSVQFQVLGSAVAVVQASISTIRELEDGVATWVDWDAGALTTGGIAQDSTKGPVGGIRIMVLGAAPGENAIVSIRCQSGHA